MDRSLEEMEFDNWWSSPEVMDGPYLSLKEGMLLAWKTRSRLSPVQGEEFPERPKPNGFGFVVAEADAYMDALEAEIRRLKEERDLLLWADSAKGKQLLEYHDALSASRADALKAIEELRNPYDSQRDRNYQHAWNVCRDAAKKAILARMEKA